MCALPQVNSDDGLNWNRVLQFVSNMAQSISEQAGVGFGGDGVRIAVLVYSRRVSVALTLQDSATLSLPQFQAAVLAIPYPNQGTNTHAALQWLERSFQPTGTPMAGSRQFAVDTGVVLVTDGVSDRPTSTELQADLLDETAVARARIAGQNFETFVVGITDAVDRGPDGEVRYIATDRTNCGSSGGSGANCKKGENYVFVDDFSQLNDFAAQIQARFCDSGCPDGQFEQQQCLAASDRSCADITICTPGLQYEVAQPTARSDRRCATATVCDYPATEYEDRPLGQRSDRTCERLSTCNSTTYEAMAPTPNSDRVCDPCPTGTFREDLDDNTCYAPTGCPAGTRRVPPPGGQPRLVSDCVPCLYGEWQPENNSFATTCRDWTPCYLHHFVDRTVVPSSTADQSCILCGASDGGAECPAGTFEELQCTSLEDRLCTPCSNCTGGLVPLESCSHSADTRCGVAEPPTDEVPETGGPDIWILVVAAVFGAVLIVFLVWLATRRLLLRRSQRMVPDAEVKAWWWEREEAVEYECDDPAFLVDRMRRRRNEVDRDDTIAFALCRGLLMDIVDDVVEGCERWKQWSEAEAEERARRLEEERARREQLDVDKHERDRAARARRLAEEQRTQDAVNAAAEASRAANDAAARLAAREREAQAAADRRLAEAEARLAAAAAEATADGDVRAQDLQAQLDAMRASLAAAEAERRKAQERADLEAKVAADAKAKADRLARETEERARAEAEAAEAAALEAARAEEEERMSRWKMVRKVYVEQEGDVGRLNRDTMNKFGGGKVTEAGRPELRVLRKWTANMVAAGEGEGERQVHTGAASGGRGKARDEAKALAALAKSTAKDGIESEQARSEAVRLEKLSRLGKSTTVTEESLNGQASSTVDTQQIERAANLETAKRALAKMFRDANDADANRLILARDCQESLTREVLGARLPLAVLLRLFPEDAPHPLFYKFTQHEMTATMLFQRLHRELADPGSSESQEGYTIPVSALLTELQRPKCWSSRRESGA